MTDFLQNKTYFPVIAATIFTIIAAIFAYDWMSDIQYVLLIAGSIIIGIPHGATDNHIFLKSNLFQTKYRKIIFYASYLLIAGIYGLFWMAFPAASLIIFLLISVYHFGQSNLFYLSINQNIYYRIFISILWGSYALGLPLLFHAGEALPVIEKILGYTVFSASRVQAISWSVAFILFGLNAGMLIIFKLTGHVSSGRFIKEILNLLILGALSYYAPLFIAFFTYWIFWHSTNSIIEINNFLFGKNRKQKIKMFYKKSWPLSLISILGIAGIIMFSNQLGSIEGMLSLYFIFIAVLTLPHVIMMDWLYANRVK